MLSRRTILGSVAVLGLGLVTVVAAFGQGMGHGRPAMMKRMATAMIDEALEPANVTADQRAKIYAARDRVFTTIEAHRQTRGAHVERGAGPVRVRHGRSRPRGRASGPSARPSTGRWPTRSARPSPRCTTC